MFEEHDKVRHKPTGEICFTIVIDEGDEGVVYGLESGDQCRKDRFIWCDEDNIESIER